jgi:hypothetical protein
LGIAPTDNFITEFLPNIASHIHVRVVLVRGIINQVAIKDGTTQKRRHIVIAGAARARNCNYDGTNSRSVRHTSICRPGVSF